MLETLWTYSRDLLRASNLREGGFIRRGGLRHPSDAPLPAETAEKLPCDTRFVTRVAVGRQIQRLRNPSEACYKIRDCREGVDREEEQSWVQ